MNEKELQELEEQTLRNLRWASKWNVVKIMFGVLFGVGCGYLTYELLSSISPMVKAWFGG